MLANAPSAADWLTAGSALLTTLVTGVLAYVAIRQMRALNAQDQLAREQLREIEDSRAGWSMMNRHISDVTARNTQTDQARALQQIAHTLQQIEQHLSPDSPPDGPDTASRAR